MWPKWLADTLDRSALEPRPHGAAAKTQRVRDLDEPALPAVDGADWDGVTGFDIHVGYGSNSPDV